MATKGAVLVVDDDPIILEVTQRRLRRAGWDVSVRDEAVGTAQWVKTHQPDVVLLDVGMPTLSGDVLASVLRRNRLTRNIRIILHSGLGNEELEVLRATTGACGAIQKTGNDTVFLTEFERLVGAFRASGN